MKILLLILMLLAACEIQQPAPSVSTNFILRATMLKDGEPVVGEEYNVESYKMRSAPMIRTYNWQIQKTDETGKLSYFVNYNLRENEKIRACVLEKCAEVTYDEAKINSTVIKTITVNI